MEPYIPRLHEAALTDSDKFKISGALKRMAQLQLSRAWESWQDVYEREAHVGYVMMGCIQRMLKRNVSKAWEKWQQDADAMLRLACGALLG